MRALDPDREQSRERLLVGIPSFRRPEGLRRLLASLAEQQGVDDVELEVFVADNDAVGRDALAVCKTVEECFRWPLACSVVQEPGISAARNAILDRARARAADYVAMIDDDEEADPDWLRELLSMQRATGADVVGGPVDYLFDRPASPTIRSCDAFKPRQWPAGRVAAIDATGNVLLSCAALNRGGWPQFDRAFGLTGGEDKDYFCRLTKAGAIFAWAPAARAREHVPASRTTVKSLLRRAYRIGNNDMRITRLHGGTVPILRSLGKALVLLGSAPLASPILALPSHRLWLLRKWSRSAGKLSALFGKQYREYDRFRQIGG